MGVGAKPVSVYVDDMRRRAKVGSVHATWSHLFADTHEELMRFSHMLGLVPHWIQHEGTHREHFDLTESKRQDALSLGATPLRYPSEVGTFIREKRERIERERSL